MSGKFYVISKEDRYYAGISATGRVLETFDFDDATKFFDPVSFQMTEVQEIAEKFDGGVKEYTYGEAAEGDRLIEFLNGYRDLVKRTGITLLSNDYDTDTYCVSVEDINTLLAIAGMNPELTDVTWKIMGEPEEPDTGVKTLRLTHTR